MYVAVVPNRGSPPAILLRESYRDGGKVQNRTLANLSGWPQDKVDDLRRVLKGQPPTLDLTRAFEVTRSLPHGHVAAVCGTAARLGMPELIDPTASRNRDLVRHAGRPLDRAGLKAGHRARAARRDRDQFTGCGARGFRL
jgi:hypothetical protein